MDLYESPIRIIYVIGHYAKDKTPKFDSLYVAHFNDRDSNEGYKEC